MDMEAEHVAARGRRRRRPRERQDWTATLTDFTRRALRT